MRITLSFILFISINLFIASSFANPWEWRYAQGLIGIQKMQGAWTIEHGQNSSTTTRDDLVYLGGLAQYSASNGVFEYGLETGGLLTAQNDINYFFISQGGIEVEIETENGFWALDLFAGGYLGIKPTPRLRIYAAAGPSLTLGSIDLDEGALKIAHTGNEGANLSINLGGRQSAADLGFYGRTGIEFLPVRDLVIGFSARKLSGKLDFENNGTINLDSTQYFLTFTRRY